MRIFAFLYTIPLRRRSRIFRRRVEREFDEEFRLWFNVLLRPDIEHRLRDQGAGRDITP